MKFSPAPDGPCRQARWPPWAPSWPGRLSAQPRPARPCPRARPRSCWRPWPGAPDRCPPLTGTVVESAALGLPDLPGIDNPSSITSLLTGSHTVRIWYADARHFRLAMPGMASESDLIVNGSTAWYWQSTTNSVTRYVLPAGGPPGRARARAGHGHHPAAGRPAGPGRGRSEHAGHRAEQRHRGRRGGLPAGARAAGAPARSSARCGSPSMPPITCRCACRFSPGARRAPRSRWVTPRSRSSGPRPRTSTSPRRPPRR